VRAEESPDAEELVVDPVAGLDTDEVDDDAAAGVVVEELVVDPVA